jgi:hypothetical protein
MVTPAPAEPSDAPNTEDKPDEMVIDGPQPMVSEQPEQIVEDEWAAPSLKKKKGKKNKKNLDSDLPTEEAGTPRDDVVSAEASNDAVMSNDTLLDAPVAVAQDTAESEHVESHAAEPQPSTTPATEETPVVNEAAEEERAAPSKKKDKKNKKKKGVAWDEPEAAPEEPPATFVEETPNTLVEETPIALEQTPHESVTMTRDMNSADNVLPAESIEPTPVTTEEAQAPDEEWGAPSKKKKGKKGKKSQDAWSPMHLPRILSPQHLLQSMLSRHPRFNRSLKKYLQQAWKMPQLRPSPMNLFPRQPKKNGEHRARKRARKTRRSRALSTSSPKSSPRKLPQGLRTLLKSQPARLSRSMTRKSLKTLPPCLLRQLMLVNKTIGLYRSRRRVKKARRTRV